MNSQTFDYDTELGNIMIDIDKMYSACNRKEDHEVIKEMLEAFENKLDRLHERYEKTPKQVS